MHRVAVVVAGDAVFNGGPPGGQVGAAQEAAVNVSADVKPLRRGEEAIDRVGHEALVPGPAGRLDLGLAAAAGGLGFAQDAAVSGGDPGTPEKAACGGHTIRQPDLRRLRPVLAEHRLHTGDGVGDAGHHRPAVLGVAQGRLHDLAETPGAEPLQQQQPATEGARHAGGKQAGAGDHVQAQRADSLDAGHGRSHSLTANHLDALVAGAVEDHRQVAARPVQMRLHDLEHEAGGDGGVEGVATALQHGHAGRAGEPVRRGDHAEGPGQLRAGRERRRHLAQVMDRP